MITYLKQTHSYRNHHHIEPGSSITHSLLHGSAVNWILMADSDTEYSLNLSPTRNLSGQMLQYNVNQRKQMQWLWIDIHSVLILSTRDDWLIQYQLLSHPNIHSIQYTSIADLEYCQVSMTFQPRVWHKIHTLRYRTVMGDQCCLCRTLMYFHVFWCKTLLTQTNSTCEYIISEIMVAPEMIPTYLSSERQYWNTT